MNTHIHKSTVLVLNRNWQAIDAKTPAQAFCMMANDSATALDIADDGSMTPMKFSEWLKLPVRARDLSIGTVRGLVRMPTVIVLARFARVPLRRPNFGIRGIWERDGGVCQYSGRKLKPSEGNIDHVVPRSRGGASSWQNCVLAHKDINTRKADRTPHEAGLKLLREPQAPKPLPTSMFIKNLHGVEDWSHFVP